MDGRTDRQYNLIIALCVASHGKNVKPKKKQIKFYKKGFYQP